MIMKRIAIKLTLIVSLAVLLGGCGFKDIDKRFFVLAMGIDAPDEGKSGYKITLRLAIPSPKIEPGAAQTQVETIHASTIAEALRLLKSHVDKELDFGHCKLYLLGEGLVKSDYTDSLRWISRRRDVSNIAYIAIGKPDAKTILNINPPAERFPGNTIFLLFGKDGTQSSYIVSVYMFDFMRRVDERGMDPIMPIMRKEKNGYVVAKLGLLDKSKLVLTLNPRETEMYNQIRNHYKKSTVTAKIKGDTLVISVDQINSHYKIVKERDGYVLKMKLNIGGIFEEAPGGIYDQDWKELEKAFNTQVAAEAKSLLVKVQKAGVDPFGFGLRYRATHAGIPQTWKDWESIYPQLKFEVQVDVDIEGSGLTR
ncbi:Ger(x)C family spore germination protein [Paenibacillus sp. CF384]|uniref:Ger(x)C family spore germination protein n=1 Tax=Paenibacillus sp. CF384 TaxID=1884382 RepID=UPI000895AFF5|nr:Ger(x)C family spore germination protein [Paenibacillus sp. CF384]SDX19272.1 germination protein, Ger(x)C family [Paenibacillus sp. CF384]